MIGAIYTRFSTSNQTDNSTETQVRICLDYAKKNNITIPAKYIFSDEEVTGLYIKKRLNFYSLLEVAKMHKIDCVIINDITRGSRDVVDWFTFRQDMEALKIKILSPKDKIGNLLDPADYLAEMVTVGMGHVEVLRYRQKSIEGRKTKAKHGVFLGGFAPFGYDIVEQKYIINTAEAEGVKTIFEMFTLGYSYSSIIKTLNEMGLIYGKRGNRICGTTLNNILHNIRYTGQYVWFDKTCRILHRWVGTKNDDSFRIDDAIPAIISKEQFYQAQEILNKRSKRAMSNAKRDYLLKGKLVCGICGEELFPRTTTKDGVENSKYVCKGRKEHGCNLVPVPVGFIDAKVKKTLKEYFENLDYVSLSAKLKPMNEVEEFKKEKAEIQKIEVKLHQMIEAIQNGYYRKSMNDESKKLEDRKDELEAYIAEHDTKGKAQKLAVEELIRVLKDETKSLTSSNLDKLVRKYIQKVVVRNDDADIYIGVLSSFEGIKKDAENSVRRSEWLPG